ncbi:putative sterigmatocystin biosynthesis peroxidase [Lachnellula suecica]|uniref:Putative sterigmatocystin biosynthesis peroxidase n=1 Tax=Lachnellula suecica TaxID=602035 RepID=A0A8T9CJ62_9HELO|nr:putative sterigmatocystin biosynthesis peroxidase [Lachnellula suecica]
MRSIILTATFLAQVLALPTTSETSSDAPPPWVAPGPNDLRSPCPLLNSLANHNIIPHDGRNITISILETAFTKYINVGNDVAIGVGGPALLLSPMANSMSFDLTDIDKHNAIEHDGSLSRDDFYFGNDHSFNPVIFAHVQSYFLQDPIEIPIAAKARLARMNTSNTTNPDFSLDTAAMGATFVESAFYLSVFGDPVTGVAPRNWVNVFFEEERLPVAEGWTRRDTETNLTTLMAMAAKIVAATPATSLSVGFNLADASHA